MLITTTTTTTMMLMSCMVAQKSSFGASRAHSDYSSVLLIVFIPAVVAQNNSTVRCAGCGDWRRHCVFFQRGGGYWRVNTLSMRCGVAGIWRLSVRRSTDEASCRLMFDAWPPRRRSRPASGASTSCLASSTTTVSRPANCSRRVVWSSRDPASSNLAAVWL